MCALRQKIIIKKHFCKYCLQCFSSEKVSERHQKSCLKINDKQSVKLRSGSIKFKNHFKRLVAPFKIYIDFESALKGLKSNNKDKAPYTKNIKIILCAALLTKLFLLMIC